MFSLESCQAALGSPRRKCGVPWGTPPLCLALLMLISSNLLEVYLTSAVMFEMKKSTKSVTNLLSRKSLADRKRYMINKVCIFKCNELASLTSKDLNFVLLPSFSCF